ncbi:MAG: STT3 domain-containing protein [Bryobacteraceae bacterium]|jgi:dolichyl-diphosphooligosaccharide--protein glycosyltransferase
MLKRLPAIAVTIAVFLAFGFRVLPAYRVVFTSHGVMFQEPDAWFHMRAVHNLLAHFPRRSGFDPYALYPGGENVVTGPFWDYLVASAAWLAGVGSPSENIVDEVGAWLPAALGALLPVPVFLLARRLFGTGAGLFSAVWVALIPGTFLWVGHLGMADHHAVEVITGFLTLTTLCAATETPGRRSWMIAVLAGVALTAYLDTQVTGIFVPAVLGVAAMLSPALAPLSATALATACFLLLPLESSGPWLGYMWLSLSASLAITIALAVLHGVGKKRNWPRGAVYGTAGAVVVAATGCMAISQAAKIHSLMELIGSFQPGRPGGGVASQVSELQPLWAAAPGGFASLFSQFGPVWVLAAPGLAAVAALAWRDRRPAVILFAVWSLTMIAGVFSHLRMAAYAGLAVAIPAGAGAAWIVRRIPSRLVWLRGLTAGIVIAIVVAGTLPVGFAQTRRGGGPDPDWWAALEWMRWKTPEPIGDRRAWYGLWPRLKPGAVFTYPASAYGIIALWDRGWWISGIARRIPAANGGGSGAVETARFLTETYPEEALRIMRSRGARYAVIEPGSVTTRLPALVAAAGRRIDDYSRIFNVLVPGGKSIRVRVYLPAFYRSMAARLYLFEGRRIESRTHGVQVYLTESVLSDAGVYEETVSSVRSFASEKEAEQWIALHPMEAARLVSADPTLSCVDLDEISWLKPVFVSRQERVVGYRQPVAVRIFELTP